MAGEKEGPGGRAVEVPLRGRRRGHGRFSAAAALPRNARRPSCLFAGTSPPRNLSYLSGIWEDLNITMVTGFQVLKVFVLMVGLVNGLLYWCVFILPRWLIFETRSQWFFKSFCKSLLFFGSSGKYFPASWHIGDKFGLCSLKYFLGLHAKLLFRCYVYWPLGHFLTLKFWWRLKCDCAGEPSQFDFLVCFFFGWTCAFNPVRWALQPVRSPLLFLLQPWLQ